MRLFQAEMCYIKYNVTTRHRVRVYLIFILGLYSNATVLTLYISNMQYVYRRVSYEYIWKKKRFVYLIKEMYGVEVLVLNLILRWVWMASLTLRPICLQGNIRLYPLAKRLHISPVKLCRGLPGIDPFHPVFGVEWNRAHYYWGHYWSIK
jgi:hypothetical protein